MKRRFGAVGPVVFLSMFAATLGAQQPAYQSRPVTATATIEAIDKANRVLTLKGAGGNSVDVTAPEQMEGFNPGDTVDVTYYESLLIKVGRPAKRP